MGEINQEKIPVPMGLKRRQDERAPQGVELEVVMKMRRTLGSRPRRNESRGPKTKS